MRDLNCFSCHSINGRGGDMAPDLTWEGSAVQRDWLLKFFKNPNTLRPTLIRRMPKFNVTDAEATILTDYILTAYQTPAFDRDSLEPAFRCRRKSKRDASSSIPSTPASPATSSIRRRIKDTSDRR